MVKIKIKEVSETLKGWSLYRLAKEIGENYQTVHSWASGRTQPNYEKMGKLKKALGCTLDDIFSV